MLTMLVFILSSVTYQLYCHRVSSRYCGGHDVDDDKDDYFMMMLMTLMMIKMITS